MTISPFKNAVCTILVWLLVALNTYPAMHAVMADMIGADVSVIPICTMNGISYVALDTSSDNDSQDLPLQTRQKCPFCFAHQATILPPCDQNIIERHNAYSERLAITQYRNTYFKTVSQRPQSRAPPLLS